MILSTTLNLPHVDRQLVPHMNNLHGLSGRMQFEMAGELFKLHFPTCTGGTAAALGLKLEIAGRELIINVDRTPFLSDVEARLGAFQLSELDPALRMVAVEAAMADLLEGFRIWSGYEALLENVTFEAMPVPADFLNVTVIAQSASGSRVNGTLGIQAEHLPWLIQLLQDGAPADTDSWHHLSLPADVCLGSMGLTESECILLEAGDILLPEMLNLPQDGVHLIVRGGPRLLGKMSDNQFVVEQVMYEEGMDQATMETDQMELDVRFELGEKRLTLGELKTVQAGTVIELDGPDASAIVVRASGQVIGKGELVQVGEHLGVRMLEVHRGNS